MIKYLAGAGIFLAFIVISLVGQLPTVANAVDVCGLYTQSDAAGLFQENVSAGVARTTMFPAGDSCRYTFNKDASSYGVQVRVCESAAIKEEGINESAADVMTRQIKAHQAKNLADDKFRLIPNLGEEAFWNGSDLYVRQKDTLLIIKVNAFLPGSFKDLQAANKAAMEQNLKLSQQVAETVLGRLK